MKAYRYETHLHTSPVSKCSRSTVREMLSYYKSLDYTGVFITNHFIDGNIACDRTDAVEDQLRFYISDYEEGVRIGHEIGIEVYLGIECSYAGTDFLVYGLDPEWYFSHTEILSMRKSEMLPILMEAGALVIQAHPFREAAYIDHIRLFPRCIHGTEVYNACRTDFENKMAQLYADSYELLHFAGSDNHRAEKQTLLGGMQSDSPIVDEKDFVTRVFNGQMSIFRINTEE